MPREERRGRSRRARDENAPAGPVPEFLRKALSLGFSGFAMTESALRRTFGESVPREWVDFVVEQSERARSEFLDRLSFELATSLEKVDLAAAAKKLFEGRRLEFKIEVRLRDDDSPRSTNREAGDGDGD